MVELRTLHITDIHDDYEKIQVIARYVADRNNTERAVDAVFCTGDFLEGNHDVKDKTAYKIIEALNQILKSGALKAEAEEFEAFVKKYGKEGKVDLDSLDEVIKKEFEDLNARSNAKQAGAITRVITESYQKHAEELGKMEVPIFGTLGNHDLTLGYKILESNVTFLEKTKKDSVRGKTGIKFSLKGDLNTFEIPPIYIKLAPLLEKYFIPYESGYSVSELSKAENTLQEMLSENPTDRLEKIKKGKEPQYSDEQLGKEKQLKEIQEFRPKVLAYNQSERQRLSDDKPKADIYLTHKLPSCKKANAKIEGSLSDITAEYAADAQAVYGGHSHDGQIGYKTIDNLLKQTAAETTTIDGVEVPVFYLEINEPWELNPGTEYFFITEYDANKQVEQVVMHQFVYEEAV